MVDEDPAGPPGAESPADRVSQPAGSRWGVVVGVAAVLLTGLGVVGGAALSSEPASDSTGSAASSPPAAAESPLGTRELCGSLVSKEKPPYETGQHPHPIRVYPGEDFHTYEGDIPANTDNHLPESWQSMEWELIACALRPERGKQVGTCKYRLDPSSKPDPRRIVPPWPELDENYAIVYAVTYPFAIIEAHTGRRVGTIRVASAGRPEAACPEKIEDPQGLLEFFQPVSVPDLVRKLRPYVEKK